MVVYVQSALGIIIAVGAVGSMWFVNRRTTVAVWSAGVESVAALALIGTVIWRDDSPWAMLPVWVLTACAALANWWMCRRTERLRALANRALDKIQEMEVGDGHADRRERDSRQ